MSTMLPTDEAGAKTEGRNEEDAAAARSKFEIPLDIPRPPMNLNTVVLPGQRISVGGRRDTTERDFDPLELIHRRVRREWPEMQRRTQFRLRQEWIGRVEGVFEETFSATLVTRGEPNDRDQAEIYVDEIAPEQRDKLRPGAVFYWVLGYRDEPTGQRIGVSEIIFRKTAAPTEAQLAEVAQEAEHVLAFLDGCS